jgi:hypothetical protein
MEDEIEDLLTFLNPSIFGTLFTRRRTNKDNTDVFRFPISESTKGILKYWGGMNGNGLGLKEELKIKLVRGEITVFLLVHVFMAVCTANTTV